MSANTLPIVLAKEVLPGYFTIADSTNSWYLTPTNTFDFINRSSNKLLVTVGDSWTWGSDISENNSNDDYRLESVWGNQLSGMMGSDWLNLALSAQGNQWMANRITEFANIVPLLNYEKILVVCVFTGAGRMFNTDIDHDFDYVEWCKQNINTPNDYYSLLELLNTTAVKQIRNSLQFPHVNLYLTTNMIDSLGFTSSFDAWYKTIGITDDKCVYTDMTAVERLLTIEEFVSGKQLVDFKQWMLQLINSVEHREQYYSDTNIFRNQHPLADYHKQWAEYVYENINYR
jgi:hypothetical protein